MGKIILLLTLFSSLTYGENIKGSLSLKSFSDAKNASTQFRFQIKSTKAALFTSTVDGYARKYSYSADYDSVNKILRNMKVIIEGESLDTNNDSRNEKLYEKCLATSKFKNIELDIPGPLFLKGKKKVTYDGTVKIRGIDKKFSIKLKSLLSNTGFSLSGESHWSFKAMGIPDPSIFIAKVNDQIDIDIKIKHVFK